MELYLRIAPELYLKRLVVGGFEKVFEIARVFRNEGLSTRHNPEFTMLELYQAYGDYHDVMALTEELVAYLAVELHGTTSLTYGGRPLDLSTPWRRASLSDLVEEHAGVRVDVRTPLGELRRVAEEHGVEVKDDYGPGKLVLEIYEKTTEAQLWGPVFVTDYPKEVSPLARDHRELPDMVERFEPIVAGRELGNAFSELVDPDEQRARFEDQARQKAAGDDEAMVVDEDYLRALEHGLPPTAGLGIGIDRLVMLLTDSPSIPRRHPLPHAAPRTTGLSGLPAPVRPGRSERWGVVALAALAPAAMLTVDPWGWYPFGPSKWLVIPTLVLVGGALVLRDRPVRVPGGVGMVLLALVGWMAVAAALGRDPLYSVDRHARASLRCPHVGAVRPRHGRWQLARPSPPRSSSHHRPAGGRCRRRRGRQRRGAGLGAAPARGGQPPVGLVRLTRLPRCGDRPPPPRRAGRSPHPRTCVDSPPIRSSIHAASRCGHTSL